MTERRSTAGSSAPSPSPSPASPTVKPERDRAWEEHFFRFSMYFMLGYIFYILSQFPRISAFLRQQGLDSSLGDFLYLIPFTVFSNLLYLFNRKVTIRYFRPYLTRVSDPQHKMSDEEYHGKCADYISASIHYIIAFSVTVFYGWKYGFLPKVYGGSLDLITKQNIALRDYPLDLRIVYMYAFGHHADRLIVHVLSKRSTATYHTMLCHHITTCGVMTMAFHMKMLMFGIPVTLLFDPSDAQLHVARFLRETSFKRMWSQSMFVWMVVTWFFTRIVGFAWEIIWPIIEHIRLSNHPYTAEFKVVSFFYLMCLSLLCVLNVFWFYQILKIFVSSVIMKKDKIEYEDRTLQEGTHRK